MTQACNTLVICWASKELLLNMSLGLIYIPCTILSHLSHRVCRGLLDPLSEEWSTPFSKSRRLSIKKTMADSLQQAPGSLAPKHRRSLKPDENTSTTGTSSGRTG